jgi:hypothetical protein
MRADTHRTPPDCASHLDLLHRVGKQAHLQRAGNGTCNFGLQFQHIGQIAVVGMRPEVKSGHRVDQLRGDAHSVT